MVDEATSGIFIGSAAGGGNPQQLELRRANRHGLAALLDESQFVFEQFQDVSIIFGHSVLLHLS
jgi:hypothetical protein